MKSKVDQGEEKKLERIDLETPVDLAPHWQKIRRWHFTMLKKNVSCVLVGIDGFLQIDTQDVIIFEKVADLKTRDYEKVVGLFSPKGNLFDLVKIGLYVLYGFALLTQSEAYGRLRVEEMVGDGDYVKAGFSVCLDDLLDLDRSVAEGGMNVKVSQEPSHHHKKINF